MSTKIYNGYKLPNWSLKELKNFYVPLTEEANNIRTELYCTQIAKDITSNVDRYNNNLQILNMPTRLKDRTSFKTYHSDLAKEYAIEQMREIQLTGCRNSEYDYEFAICFIPIDNAILALLYTEHKELTDLWENCQHVSDYGYWNNEEQNAGITDEEWEQRRIDWDIALGESGVPANIGVSFDPFKDTFFIRHNNNIIVDNIPDKDERAKYIAKEILWLEYYNKEKQYVDDYSAIKLALNFTSVLQNEYKEKYEELQLEIKDTLVDITIQYISEDIDFTQKDKA